MNINSKKATIGWSEIMYIILGLVVLVVVIMGIIGPGVNFAKKRFFNEEAGKWVWPWSTQQEFVPYNPEEHLTKEEVMAQDSVKALQCAVNSMAVGSFDYTKTDICPAGYTKQDNSIYYGLTNVNCTGIASRLLSFEGKTKEQAIQTLGEAVEECYTKSKGVKLYTYTMCSYYDPSENNANIVKSITKKDIKDYLNKKNTEDSKNAAGKLGSLTNTVKTNEVTFSGGGCIYYNSRGSDTIDIRDCKEDNPTDSFSCSVNNFQLPQNITTAQKWIPAFGDPEYLVYYEKFPAEAAVYWQKEWSDMFNLYTIGFVTTSGILNTVGAGKLTKAGVKVGKEALTETLKEGLEKATKESIEAGAEYILKRANKATLNNILRTLIVEGEASRIFGVSELTARKIGDIIATKIGKTSGKEAFAKVEKELGDAVLDIVKQDVKKLPSGFSWQGTLEEYQQSVAKLMMEGGETVEGLTIKGVKEVVENQVSKTATKELIQKQLYSQFFESLIKKGTTELSEELLQQQTEKAILRLGALYAIDNTLVEKSFLAGAEKVGKIFLTGTLGDDTVLGIAKKSLPIKWDSKTIFGKLAFGVPEWVKNHPLPSALFFSVLLDGADSTNEKYVPVGVNSIAITKPSLLGGKKTFDLNSLAEKYFLANKIDYKLYTKERPLYFVSPCKANLNLVKRKCTCANNPTNSMFNFGGGLMNVEPGTIQLKEDDQRISIYKTNWYKMTPEEKNTEGTESSYINKRFASDDRTFVELVQKGNVDPDSIKKTIYDKNVYDLTAAVKSCDDRTVVNGISDSVKKGWYSYLGSWWAGTGYEPTQEQWTNTFNKNIDYTTDCIEIEPERLDGYCYDYFPKTEAARNTITLGTFVVDAVIIGFTGGWATPIALAGSGLVFASTDVVLEMGEKWP